MNTTTLESWSKRNREDGNIKSKTLHYHNEGDYIPN